MMVFDMHLQIELIIDSIQWWTWGGSSYVKGKTDMRSLRGYRRLGCFYLGSGFKAEQLSAIFNFFCALRNVCGKRGMAVEAERILEELLTSGVQADVVSWLHDCLGAEGILAHMMRRKMTFCCFSE